jgi:tRNA-specific 2-thiouridylase
LVADSLNWIAIEKQNKPFDALVKIRYLHDPYEATVYPQENNSVKIVFKSDQRAITPGQSVVFYNDQTLLGGGLIVS